MIKYNSPEEQAAVNKCNDILENNKTEFTEIIDAYIAGKRSKDISAELIAKMTLNSGAVSEFDAGLKFTDGYKLTEKPAFTRSEGADDNEVCMFSLAVCADEICGVDFGPVFSKFIIEGSVKVENVILMQSLLLGSAIALLPDVGKPVKQLHCILTRAGIADAIVLVFKSTP